MAATKTALFFEVFAKDRTTRTFAGIFKSTDTLAGKISALGKLALGAAATGFATLAGIGTKAFLDFDDKMTQSLAIMGEISGPMRERMENAARQVAKTTRFSAAQAAESYFFLASAGLSAEQSISAMPQVAKFATAGMFDLARATDLATDAQSALGLVAKDPARNLENLTRVTDVLTAANILSNATVEQFSTSLTTKAGPALRAVGKDIEEGVAVLAAFAAQGIKGEEAGTQLAIVMRDLQTRALANKDAFERAGVAVFDSSGEMNNLGDIIGQLERRLSGMSDAAKRAELAQLGFTDKSVGALLALLGMSDQIKQYEADLRGMAGVTEDVAKKQDEAFAGKLRMVQNRVIDFGITIGKALVVATFAVGETVGEMGRMFGDLPAPVKVATVGLLGLAVSVPLVIGALRKLRAMARSVQLALAAMSTTARFATLSAGAIGIALAAGAAVLAFYARKNIQAEERVDALTDSIDRQTHALTKNTRILAFKNLEEDGAIANAKKLGIDLNTLADAYLGDAHAIQVVNSQLEAHIGKTQEASRFNDVAQEKLTEEAEAAALLSGAISEGNIQVDEAIQRSRDRAAAGLEAADADEEMAAATETATAEIVEQVDAVKELVDNLDDMVSTVFKARDAERDYEAALDDAREALKRNGATLDINTEKGRDNEKALDRIAESARLEAARVLEAAERQGDLAAGHEEATDKMKDARREFIKVAREMGLTKDEAKDLADQLGLIPGNYVAKIAADTSGAMRQVGAFLTWVDQQTGRVRIVGTGFAGGFAHGGTAPAGSTAVVGERGPELVRFGADARVFSNSDTVGMLRQALRGGDGASSVVRGGLDVRLLIDSGGTEWDEALAASLRRSLRKNPALRADLKAL
jgi:TP901 family phage tail tape measure protein